MFSAALSWRRDEANSSPAIRGHPTMSGAPRRRSHEPADVSAFGFWLEKSN